jgi:hypothetical protein
MTRRHYITADDVAGVSRPEYRGQYKFDRPLSHRKKLLWWGLAMLACAAIWLGFILLALRAM